MSERIESNPPAFPGIREYTYGGGEYSGKEHVEGMTLLDYFAGQALVGELASTSSEACANATVRAAARADRTPEQQLASNCYEIAAAMLAERAKATTPAT